MFLESLADLLNGTCTGKSFSPTEEIRCGLDR